MSPVWELLIVFCLIILHGFFNGAEIAILTAKRGRLEQQAKLGSRGAKLALLLAGDANRFLSTVQVGITLVGTLAAAFGGAKLTVDLAEWLKTSKNIYISTYGQGLALAVILASA